MSEYHFSYRLKVRYSEIDGQKIVFNAHYLTYIDVAVSEYFSSGLELDLNALSASGEFDTVVAKSTIEYLRPAKLGDILDIFCRTVKIGHTSLIMNLMIARGQEELVKAEMIYVSIDPFTHTPVRVPSLIRERITEFEHDG